MRVAIVGNNVAGITTAKSIRELRQDIDVIVFSEEGYNYYPRPALIEFISGKMDEKALSFYTDDWYVKNRIKVNLGTKVEKIDSEEKRLLVNGLWVDYDALVLATGARPFMPPFKGMPKKNVFTLRTLDDAKTIKSLLQKTKSAVIIGGGLLGLEVARAINTVRHGIGIKVLEKTDSLLSRQLDREGGGILRALIEEMGIDVLTSVEVDEIKGGDSVEAVRLKDGREMEAQLVVVSAGVRPNIDLARDSGLKINKGLIVDANLCCNKRTAIFAAGDVVEYEGMVYGIIPAALDQAKIVAKMIVSQEAQEYTGTIPSNTLKVMGVDLTSIGIVNPPTGDAGYEEIRAKSDDGRIYKKFTLSGGRLIGAILLGSRKEIPKISKLIKEGASVEGLKGRMRQIDFDFSGL